jgi:hypothetical protein
MKRKVQMTTFWICAKFCEGKKYRKGDINQEQKTEKKKENILAHRQKNIQTDKRG